MKGSKSRGRRRLSPPIRQASQPGTVRCINTNLAEKNRLKITAYMAAQNNMPMRWTPGDNWSAAFSFGSGGGQRNLCYALLL